MFHSEKQLHIFKKQIFVLRFLLKWWTEFSIVMECDSGSVEWTLSSVRMG